MSEMNQDIKDQIAHNIMINGSKHTHYCRNCGCAKIHHEVIDRRTGEVVARNQYYSNINMMFGRCRNNDSCNHFERAFI